LNGVVGSGAGFFCVLGVAVLRSLSDFFVADKNCRLVMPSGEYPVIGRFRHSVPHSLGEFFGNIFFAMRP